MKIWVYSGDDDAEGEVSYDIFVHEDSSLHRTYPVWMTVKDLTLVKVHVMRHAARRQLELLWISSLHSYIIIIIIHNYYNYIEGRVQIIC